MQELPDPHSMMLKRHLYIVEVFKRHYMLAFTPGFLIYDFSTDRKSSILEVWAAPGGRETFQKGWGLRPPPFRKVSRLPGAARTRKIDDFRSVKKSYIKHPGVC